MELRELADTGVMLPEIGFGTWKYRGGTAPLRRAIELGASFIDTAEIYGTEKVVGEALKGQSAKVFLATKVSGSNLKYDQVLRAADASLKRLGVKQIDLYQVHWPNSRVPIGDTMRAMEALVDAGKVRFIGVSNFSRDEFEEAQEKLKKYKIVSNQVEYSLVQRDIERDIETFYEPNKVTVIAYSPLARGALLAQRKQGLEVLKTIAAKARRTPAQVAINWCLRHPCVVAIPKTDKVARVDEDCGASGWRLTTEENEALDQAFS
jgi:diketogulonate reductase-like aldo/keto reductase